jgi:hypothetical protein
MSSGMTDQRIAMSLRQWKGRGGNGMSGDPWYSVAVGLSWFLFARVSLSKLALNLELTDADGFHQASSSPAR